MTNKLAEIKIRHVSEQTRYAIDRIVAEKNKNAKKKISRQIFLKEWLERIPENYLNQKQDSEVSLELKEQNNLLKENIKALNVLAAYFISNDIEETQKGLELLEKIGDDKNEN
ncbi:hypothetical protein [Lactobacillus sp. ESL0681]|uniref:hypothetical protein n=1 Tax=Lactobacillus sp. ESL0681 TaxID=2983211 RepID=UPI0023F957A0|nr:hypothetical protein [Lactobacillus sp. ESL0681]WEV41280.1 hypothetical protein OZX59_09440 [Lactobacillus sp. ESL0681]